MKPDLAMWAVTRLETFRWDQLVRRTFKLAQATGFFYKTGDSRLFIVTNKHVLYEAPSHKRGKEDDKNYVPDTLRFSVHSKKGSSPDLIGEMKVIRVRLWSKEGQKLWLEHTDRAIDVAALQVSRGKLEAVGAIIAPFSRDDLLGGSSLSGLGVGLGVPALVVGYPLGFYDGKTGLPVARTAWVASIPWLGFEGKPRFLVDGRLHVGMSGSPVISSVGELHWQRTEHQPLRDLQANSPSYLLGIFSSEWTAYSEPLGLNNVWHADLIKEIVTDR